MSDLTNIVANRVSHDFESLGKSLARLWESRKESRQTMTVSQRVSLSVQSLAKSLARLNASQKESARANS